MRYVFEHQCSFRGNTLILEWVFPESHSLIHECPFCKKSLAVSRIEKSVKVKFSKMTNPENWI